MGLLYITPVDLSEVDYAQETPQGLLLKSYGLPLIFWFYLATVWLVILVMVLISWTPLMKLYHTADPLNQMLALACWLVLSLPPLFMTALFFYQKHFLKKSTTLTITHRVFGLPLRRERLELQESTSFSIDHFIDAPNMARLKLNPDYRAFYNKGFFELKAQLTQGTTRVIDRHNRKSDLIKIKELLSRY